MPAETKAGVKVGDVVVLKSGGPKMVAQRVDDDPSEVECAWIDDGQLVQHARFPAECLDVQPPAARRRGA